MNKNDNVKILHLKFCVENITEVQVFQYYQDNVSVSGQCTVHEVFMLMCSLSVFEMWWGRSKKFTSNGNSLVKYKHLEMILDFFKSFVTT